MDSAVSRDAVDCSSDLADEWGLSETCVSPRRDGILKEVKVGEYPVGVDQPLLLIAGPCVIQDRELSLRIAEKLAEIANGRNLNLVFKASFDKANRTRLDSFRGVGLEAGLQILDDIKQRFAIPVTTDVHLPAQAASVAEVCDLLQIPAFLCRQTDLIVAAAETGKAVNVKKGQFMAPNDMQHVVEKLSQSGCRNVMLCERGTFFGYGQLVNDMRSLPMMRELGCPVVFDATHSVQQPGGSNGVTGGNREMVPVLARAAMAVGVDGLFLETHPDPDSSPSDGANMVRLEHVSDLLDSLLRIREAACQ